jgi:hypothetical protein
LRDEAGVVTKVTDLAKIFRITSVLPVARPEAGASANETSNFAQWEFQFSQ